MKKHTLIRLFFLGMILVITSILFPSGRVLAASSTVTTFDEFKTAAADPSVTDIIISNNIDFKSNVTLANRSVTISGASNQVQIDAGLYSLQGNRGTQAGSLSINNLTIVSSANKLQDRPFFKAPNSWNVLANGINYRGPVFANVANGQLTFSGTNTLHTVFENADVRELIFETGSHYEGIAADLSKSAGFNFNGDLVNSQVVGTVDVQKDADVSLTLAPNHSGDSYYYPAFYGNYHRLTVNERAKLAIDAAGTALGFSSFNSAEKPSVTVEKDAELLLNGHGGGQYPVLNLEPPTNVIVNQGTLNVTGSSRKGIVKAEYSSSAITLNEPKAFLFKNRTPDQPIFYDAQTLHFQINKADLSVWEKIGGEYESTPKYTWEEINLDTYITGSQSDPNNTLSNNADLQSIFQSFDYGCISGKAHEVSHECIPPTFNPVNDQDTQLTGTGNPDCTITAVNRATGEVLGTTTVNADGRWTINLATPQKAGTIIDVTQTCTIGNCDPITVTQEVTHLAAETVNYFKLGYWQGYGMILEGSIDNADWDLSNKNSVHKVMYLEDANGQDVLTAKIMSNTDWYQKGNFNGYQAIIVNEQMTALPSGLYKMKIGITVDGTAINEIQDVNIVNTKFPTKIYYPGPYHQKFTEIESRTYPGNITISTVSQNGKGYIKIDK